MMATTTNERAAFEELFFGECLTKLDRSSLRLFLNLDYCRFACELLRESLESKLVGAARTEFCAQLGIACASRSPPPSLEEAARYYVRLANAFAMVSIMLNIGEGGEDSPVPERTQVFWKRLEDQYSPFPVGFLRFPPPAQTPASEEWRRETRAFRGELLGLRARLLSPTLSAGELDEEVIAEVRRVVLQHCSELEGQCAELMRERAASGARARWP